MVNWFREIKKNLIPKKKRYYQALADLNKLLEIDPNNVDVLRIRGETYYMMGKDEESL